MHHPKLNTLSLAITIALIISLTACTGAATPTPTPLPTATLAPTDTSTSTSLPPTNTDTPAPTTTSTNTPRPTATATPVPQPGDILLSDTFDDNKNNWKSPFGGGDAVIEVSNGSLSLAVKSKSIINWASSSKNFADVDMTFETTLATGGNSNTLFGAVCRGKDDINFYWFALTADGYYTITKFVDGKPTPLVDFTPSSAIHAGKATNTVRVICSGDKLQLTVNDRILATLQDHSLLEGSFGLSAGTFDQPNSTVTFDNLIVKLPQLPDTFIVAVGGGGGNGGGGGSTPGSTPVPTEPPQPTTPPTGNGQLIIVMCQSINTAVTIFSGGQIVKQNSLTSAGVNVYDLPAGHYDVQFNAEGYYNLNVSYDILPGQAITQYIGSESC